MTTKEKIIIATLELAAENGLGSVSMSQIAERLGIRKPSLYNHFESKEAIIEAMYHFLRERSKMQLSLQPVDLGEMVSGRTAEEVLSMTVGNYADMNSQKEMLAFYKVIYSQRSIDPTAAKIVAEETERMVLATKNLFYALHAFGKLAAEDIDTAAVSFAMCIHSMLDYQQDLISSGQAPKPEMISGYIEWFCKQYGRNENE